MTNQTITDSEKLDKFLREEVDRINRATRWIWIVGGFFAIIMIIYMSAILHMARTFLDPENAAWAIAEQMQSNTPQFLDQIEVSLKLKAPEIANHVTETFLKSVPELRRVAEDQINFTYEEMIPHLSVEFQNMIKAYIADNGEIIREFAQNHNNHEFADFFTEEMLSLLGEHLNETLYDDYSGRDFEYIQENCLYALLSMNEHLGQLLSDDPALMDRRELLQRRILAALTQRLLEASPQ